MRELTEMQRLSGASALALELQTKKNQQLLSQLHTAEAQIARLLDDAEALKRERDALRDNVICSFCGATYPIGQEPPQHWMTCKESPLVGLLADKDRELGEMAGRLTEATDATTRLLDVLEQTQAQRDATQAELNNWIETARFHCRNEMYWHERTDVARESRSRLARAYRKERSRCWCCGEVLE